MWFQICGLDSLMLWLSRIADMVDRLGEIEYVLWVIGKTGLHRSSSKIWLSNSIVGGSAISDRKLWFWTGFISDTQLISCGELRFSFFKRSLPKFFHNLGLWLQPQVIRMSKGKEVMCVAGTFHRWRRCKVGKRGVCSASAQVCQPLLLTSDKVNIGASCTLPSLLVNFDR